DDLRVTCIHCCWRDSFLRTTDQRCYRFHMSRENSQNHETPCTNIKRQSEMDDMDTENRINPADVSVNKIDINRSIQLELDEEIKIFGQPADVQNVRNSADETRVDTTEKQPISIWPKNNIENMQEILWNENNSLSSIQFQDI